MSKVIVSAEIAKDVTTEILALSTTELNEVYGNGKHWDGETVRKLAEEYEASGFTSDSEKLGDIANTLVLAFSGKNFTVAAVRQKLSGLGVYVKKAGNAAAVSRKVVTKQSVVNQIAQALDVTPLELDTLEKANMAALDKVLSLVLELTE